MAMRAVSKFIAILPAKNDFEERFGDLCDA
jgi:hypothetical protein